MKKNILISMLIAVFVLGSFLVAMPNASAAEIYGYVRNGNVKGIKKPPVVGARVTGISAEPAFAFCQPPATSDSKGFYRLRCDNAQLNSRYYMVASFGTRISGTNSCDNRKEIYFTSNSDSIRVDFVLKGQYCSF